MYAHKLQLESGDTVKFVVAGRVALFESQVNGYRRTWEHPITRIENLTAAQDTRISPNDTVRK